MTNIFYDLTDKFDKKTVAILSEIDRIAGRLRLVYFIVGATARDILLQYAHNIYATRATVDVDIGVLVSDSPYRTIPAHSVRLRAACPSDNFCVHLTRGD